jgi:hypothetical protein
MSLGDNKTSGYLDVRYTNFLLILVLGMF